jgi:DnaJ-class molecular chaperone
MTDRHTTGLLIRLLRIIRNPDHGGCVTFEEMGTLEEADRAVLLSDESCQWCGGAGKEKSGATCPECKGTGMREG